MSEVVFTFPGKLGDALLQWPVARQWAKQAGKKFTVWMDENTCKPLEALFASQNCVNKVEYKEGIEGYACGGQPWHFNLKTEDFKDKTIYHLGFRGFPVRQITLETIESAKLTIKLDRDAIAKEQQFDIVPAEPKRRLILHGQAIYAHTKQTPSFWTFLSSIAGELGELFDDIVFVGNERDREVGQRTYPEWKTFDDGGSFLELARLIAASDCVIGVGSSVVALSGALKVPTIRVHDNIGTAPKVIWSNLGDNQVNDTELELRMSWPTFRDKWLLVSA